MEFKDKFKIDELLLFKSKYWCWSLRPGQITLASSILSLNRECSQLSDVKKKEFEDLGFIVDVIENTLYKSFKYNKINYLMLMMVDSQVHYHIIPRYENTKILNGYNWRDLEWPNPPVFNNVELDEKQLIFIRDHIRNELEQGGFYNEEI